MPSLIEKMQPWTQSSFLSMNLLRRSGSTSSTNSSSPLTTTAFPSTASLISTSGGSGSSSNSGGSEIMLKNDSGNSKSSSTRVGHGAGSSRFFGKICSTGSTTTTSSNGSKNSSSVSSKTNNNNNSGNNTSSSNTSSNNNGTVSNGSRPKRKTPILSTCMNNWVKFDHDCQKPLHCTECESNQELNRRVLFSSGGNVLISTGNSIKGKHHHHRLSHNFFGGSSNNSHLHPHHNHHHVNSKSLSEPSSPTDCTVVGNGSLGDSHSGTFPGEVVSWENVKNKSSFKIVINVPCLDMNLFQNDNVQVEIVCNKNKLPKGKKDLETVQRTHAELRCSGWYWEGIDSEASMEILESTQPGAFIIRDSADPRFLYSLSIQTERGPTSVRLPYRNGKFSLDGDEKLAERVPKFDSVIGLIEHYVNGGTKMGKQVSVWIDHEGNMHSAVKLTKPVRKDVGSLKHLARVAINKHNILSNNNNNSTSSNETDSSTHITTNAVISSPGTSSSADVQKVSSVTFPSAAKSHSPVVSSPVEVASVKSSKTVSSVPKNENTITSSSSAAITAPVADLSKLPPSLQTYMLDYPYKL